MIDTPSRVRYCPPVDSLTVRPGLLVRLLRAVGLVKVQPKTGQVEHSAGADFVPDLAFRGGYDTKSALSALAAFPWPFACSQAISTDLSGVPLRAYRGKGADAEMLDSHPVLDLLERPSSRVGSTLFRRQLYTDMVLTGNAFILLAGSGGRVESLLRLHHSRTTISPMTDGQPNEYHYESGGGHPMQYPYEAVLHVRAPSWSDDPSNLWGTGCVQPLHHDLSTELAQAALTARTAATGQPTGILSPREEGDRWGKEQIATLRSAYESQMQKGGSSVLILGGQAAFEKIQFTPREMEFSQVRDFVRGATIAAFGVVPVRLGLESSNFATAQSQMRLYWESLRGRAALVDESLTRLARLFDEDITVRHDFSGVEALQESRTERLNRVTSWAMMGVPVSEAAAYEGFDDLPFTPSDDAEAEAPAAEPDEVTAEPTDEPTDEGAEADEPLAATALNGAQIASLLSILGSVAMGAITFDAALALIGVAFPTIPEGEAVRILEGAQSVPTDADEEMLENGYPSEAETEDTLRELIDSIEHRAVNGLDWIVTASAAEVDTVWRAFVDDVQEPAEKAIEKAMFTYLRGHAARIAARVPKVLAQRAVGDGSIVFKIEGDWLGELVQEFTEGQVLSKAIKSTITEAYELAIGSAFDKMPGTLAGDFEYDPARLDKMVDKQHGELIVDVPGGTRM